MATADLLVDWRRVAEATAYYRLQGFQEIAVPWVCGKEAYYATKPPHHADSETWNGYLVGSAEQSLMQMMLDGRLAPGRYQCATPCFRREDSFDDLHLPYFFKVELMWLLATPIAHRAPMVALVVATARAFYERHVFVAEKKLGEGGTDLVSEKLGIELGSYGVREWRGHHWIYGTGLAEPRLAQAIEREGVRPCRDCGGCGSVDGEVHGWLECDTCQGRGICRPL